MPKERLLIIEPTTTIFNRTQINELSDNFDLTHRIGMLDSQNDLDYDHIKLLAIDHRSSSGILNNKVLDRFGNLKTIHAGTTGDHWIDKGCRSDLEITTINDYCSNACADYIIDKIKTIEAFNNIKNSDLLKEGNRKTIGILGLGNVGSKTAELCTKLGYNVIYYSNSSRNQNYKFVGIEKVFSDSDFIVLTLANNKYTRELINPQLETLNPNQSVVAISGIENQELIQKVNKGKIGYYAFDFFSKEPVLELESPKILGSNGIAWDTPQSNINKSQSWYNNIMRDIL
jgi:phosphoglycerate dehydrogenase-like enzyme